MYQWGVDGNMTFCVKRINPSLSQFETDGTCNSNKVHCNGYCFEN